MDITRQTIQWVVVMAFLHSNSYAQDFINCQLSLATSVKTSQDNQFASDFFALDLWIPDPSHCNRTYNNTVTTSEYGSTATANVQVNNRFNIINGSYVFESSARSFTTVSSAAGEAAKSEGKTLIRSILLFNSDAPFKFSFTGTAYGSSPIEADTGYFNNGIHYVPLSNSRVGLIGDTQVIPQSLTENSLVLGNTYSETGELMINSGSQGFYIVASSAANAHLDGLTEIHQMTAEGARWSYQLVITPVPEPFMPIMLATGIAILGCYARKNRQVICRC